PELGRYRPTVVKDFPSFLGTMAKPKDDEPELLERFEIFIGSLELANGFSELTDPKELERRMRKVSSALERDGLPGTRVDREFLEASARLGRCAGVSVGMDRLAMLAMGADEISEVIFPFRAWENR
ncbi:MAG: amino acid--tRNA ligase-related protein, partial [bacterium]